MEGVGSSEAIFSGCMLSCGKSSNPMGSRCHGLRNNAHIQRQRRGFGESSSCRWLTQP